MPKKKHRGPISNVFGFVASLWSVVTFLFLVIVYVFHQLLRKFISIRFFPNSWVRHADNLYAQISRIIDGRRQGRVDRSYLISLSLRNMQVKKTRTFVTMGGMAIGIAFIVFLVSVGYGLQNLVISRVARLEELKQADVLPGLTPDLVLNDETIAQFSKIPNVTQALPVIAVVGRISYQNSVSDMAVYGVTADYLKNSAIQPVKGEIFESNDVITKTKPSTREVTKVTSHEPMIEAPEVGNIIGGVEFSINQGAWLRVRETPTANGKLLGFTRRVAEKQTGSEVWGSSYGSASAASGSAALDKWVSSTVMLWQEADCTVETNPSCEDGYIPVTDDNDVQTLVDGYIAEISMRTTLLNQSGQSQVLGISIAQAQTGSLPLIEIASESAQTQQSQTKIIDLPNQGERVAVVNRSVLQVLGVTEAEAIGKEVTMTFVIVGELQSDEAEKIESAPISYTIVGVTPDEGTPMVYVPFLDLRSLGIVKYSQAKVVVASADELQKVRSTIEASGYGTVSVSDTVAQIDNLFTSFRLVLAVLGLVALSVAALGMFNTLTVSLLERTREVGLMKAMGMKSQEVKELFLTESMIMGFFGGVIGLILGILMGKILSLVLSAFSLVKGVGFVDISYVPLAFILSVIGLSVTVGILTGYFPARRATKISALNALRYE